MLKYWNILTLLISAENLIEYFTNLGGIFTHIGFSNYSKPNFLLYFYIIFIFLLRVEHLWHYYKWLLTITDRLHELFRARVGGVRGIYSSAAFIPFIQGFQNLWKNFCEVVLIDLTTALREASINLAKGLFNSGL